MADRLARVFGTEEDKVNCSFFFKIGACRHGEKCTRLHYKPPQSYKYKLSVTLLIPHMYEQSPIELAMAEGQSVPEEEAKKAVRHFEDFYEEVF
jgi:splicing factor U2AF subunit